MAWVYDFRKFKRELPKEWKGLVPTEVFINESMRLVEAAGKKGIPLRILGGLAIAIHSPEVKDTAIKLKRTGTGSEGQEYSDIDLMSYSKHKGNAERFFAEEGYVMRTTTLPSAYSQRQIYYHPRGWFYVDLFRDKLLVANHPLDFRGRLELDYPTVPLADLLLEKIQIWEAFSEKDLKDCLILLKAHDVGDGEDEVNGSYMAQLLASDWGFWYTATTNLRRIRDLMERLDEVGRKVGIEPNVLIEKDREDIIRKLDLLLKLIEDEPKSLKWKMRSKIGTKRVWYNIVERPETVGGFGIWEPISVKD